MHKEKRKSNYKFEFEFNILIYYFVLETNKIENGWKSENIQVVQLHVLNNINHFKTLPQSPDLMPIEMVLKIIIYSFKIMKYTYSIILGLE